jgi:hypothetical protein
VLNEQGSRYFRRYLDSNGVLLFDKNIGAWETVEADSASITDIKGNICFRLARKDGTILRRGREFIRGFQDWVGLDYELGLGNSSVFEYEIEILGM